ncbi:Translation initiation factor eIF-2B subunit beta [Boothiomyces sp. JEL0866]|nr:Translation initiation factor eIF-2B subunit beta [Boothiomyces sp. JEL0866]
MFKKDDEISKLLNKDSLIQVENFITKLKRRQLVGSYQVTLETAKLLRNVILGSKWNEINGLLNIVTVVGDELAVAQPIEFAALNTCKRILRIISDEDDELRLRMDNSEDEDEPVNFRDEMKALVSQGLSELLDEVEIATQNISSQALEHIHSNEIIMTCGTSPVVIDFLKEAARFRKFQVIIAETAPTFEGHALASKLSSNGIDTSVITDSAIFAVMARVNKVILGAHAVTANGGFMFTSGSQVISAAAKHHSTPVVVLACLHTLTPNYMLHEIDSKNLFLSPNNVIGFENGEITHNVDLPNQYFDYVEPDLVSLIITNIGPHPPSEIQRLVSESYQLE